MHAKSKILILVPVHRLPLTDHEIFSLKRSLSILSNRPSCFLVPESLSVDSLHLLFPDISIARFDNEHFRSKDTYSSLLVQKFFYEKFRSFEFILILQPDAIIISDDLDYWCDQPYDYIGAPWYNGYEFNVNLDRFGGGNGRVVRIHVGNGGLSLRRVSKCINLINEFPESSNYFSQTGSNEDFFFGLLGSLSNSFILPNEITASRFSMEHNPEFYFTVNGKNLPMGAHGWSSINPDFWMKYIHDLPELVQIDHNIT